MYLSPLVTSHNSYNVITTVALLFQIVAYAGGFTNNKDEACDNCEFSPTGLSRKKREVGELPPGVPFPVGTVAVRVINSHSDRGTVTGLQPWSMYTMIVFGYNNAGLGEINQNLETITTLDSSKYIHASTY